MHKPTQLDRIEKNTVTVAKNQVALSQRMDAMIGLFKEILAHQSRGMTPEEQAAATARLNTFADRLESISEQSPPS